MARTLNDLVTDHEIEPEGVRVLECDDDDELDFLVKFPSGRWSWQRNPEARKATAPGFWDDVVANLDVQARLFVSELETTD